MALPILSVVGHLFTSQPRRGIGPVAVLVFAMRYAHTPVDQHIAEICEQIDDENEDSKDQRQALYHGIVAPAYGAHQKGAKSWKRKRYSTTTAPLSSSLC